MLFTLWITRTQSGKFAFICAAYLLSKAPKPRKVFASAVSLIEYKNLSTLLIFA